MQGVVILHLVENIVIVMMIAWNGMNAWTNVEGEVFLAAGKQLTGVLSVHFHEVIANFPTKSVIRLNLKEIPL
mgnify:CR=1 FL=1